MNRTRGAVSKAIIRGLGLGCAGLVLSLAGGCTPAQTLVLQMPPSPQAGGLAPVALVSVEQEKGLVELTKEQAEQFRDRLVKKLTTLSNFKEAGAANAADERLVIRYRFVHLDSGNVVARGISGAANLFGSPFYGVGDGAVAVEAKYLNRQGVEQARIVALGPISGALASSSSAIDASADIIARFAAETWGIKPEYYPNWEDKP
ncbi:MAG: hypothetical protein IBJ18_10235 [Phycisphaerales bacterium]|nr:hypothetical protein [Phycisphaerales bacterium]